LPRNCWKKGGNRNDKNTFSRRETGHPQNSSTPSQKRERGGKVKKGKKRASARLIDLSRGRKTLSDQSRAEGVGRGVAEKKNNGPASFQFRKRGQRKKFKPVRGDAPKKICTARTPKDNGEEVIGGGRGEKVRQGGSQQKRKALGSVSQQSRPVIFSAARERESPEG